MYAAGAALIVAAALFAFFRFTLLGNNISEPEAKRY